MNNYLYGERGVDAATGGIFARRLQFHIRNFLAFPGFRFEVYGCDDEELFVGGNFFTQLKAPHNLIPNQVETVGVLCGTNLTFGGTEHTMLDREADPNLMGFNDPSNIPPAGGAYGIASVESCKKICAANKNCGSFSYVQSTNKCITFSHDCGNEYFEPAQVYANVTSYRRIMPARNKC